MADQTCDLFVGSSSEFLKLDWNPAEVIEEVIGDTILKDGSRLCARLWDKFFEDHPGASVFPILNIAAKTSEWAVFIFRADDVWRRASENGDPHWIARDNVVFELGLLLGYLSPKRVFIIEQLDPERPDLHFASDIANIQRYQFDDVASFRVALTKLRDKIVARSEEPVPQWVPASSLALGYCAQAIIPFSERRVTYLAGARPLDERRFTIEILVPVESLESLGLRAVNDCFVSADFESISPEGEAKVRPCLWIPKKENGNPRTFYDIPTTLHTVHTVIEKYLGEDRELEDQRRLVRSQARAFANCVRRDGPKIGSRLLVKEFADMEEIQTYLEGIARG